MNKIGKFLEPLALRVASGRTIAAAAEEIGCSTSHGYTLSSSPEFRQRVGELRSAMTDQAVGELAAGAAEAVSTLRALAREGSEPSVRLQAASKLLALLGPISEANEIRRRLSELEQQTPILKVAQ
jgi:hypothetical protein